MTIKQLVHQCLREDKRARNDDDFLYFMVMAKRGLVQNQTLTFWNMKKGPAYESVRRSRQKIQEENPELGSDEDAQLMKNAKEALKGEFINTNIF